jgi:plastocyanin
MNTHNSRTSLIAFGVLVLIGGGMWLFGIRQATAPSTVLDEVEVDQNATGLTPDTLLGALERQEATSTQLSPTLTTPPATVSPKPRPIVTPAPQKVSSIPPRYPTYAVVAYNDGSFSPRKVTIVKGGTVRFVNLSSKDDMWIASDLHPIHNGYPTRDSKNCSGYAFNQCKAVGKSGYYEFTFERQGTFGFHNEIDPSITGKVEVNNPDEKPSIPGY